VSIISQFVLNTSEAVKKFPMGPPRATGKPGPESSGRPEKFQRGGKNPPRSLFGSQILGGVQKTWRQEPNGLSKNASGLAGVRVQIWQMSA
jgi:hypothetical protein